MSDRAIPTGTLFAGKYAITRMIGRGAMSSVYEAQHVEVGKRVAIKVIERQYAQNEEVCARFRQEASAAGRIESENIVHVFDVGSDPTHGLFMVMEFLVGEDLGARLDREPKLAPALAVHIAVQAARGLSKAHAAGVVHRDLKPTNIFLVAREDGTIQVKLVDFGISKLLGPQGKGQRALTRVGTTVGTPQYMSPEQVRGNPIDERTDVWALGAVLFEMLAGAPAYAHDLTHEQTVLAVVTEPPPRLRDVAPWVPGELADVVTRAMTPSLDGRIRDCNELAALLTEAMPAAVRPRREVSLAMDVPSGPHLVMAAAMPEGAAPTPRQPPAPIAQGPATVPALRAHRPREESSTFVRALGLLALFAFVGVASFYAVRHFLLKSGLNPALSEASSDEGEDVADSASPSASNSSAPPPKVGGTSSKSVRSRATTSSAVTTMTPPNPARPPRSEPSRKGS